MNEIPTTIQHELLPYQGLILKDKTTKTMGIVGGIGSGKTVLQCFWLHMGAIEFAGGNFWFASRTMKTARDPGLRTYLALLNGLGLIEGVHYSYTLNPLQVKYAWGSVVTFVSSEGYKDWVGASLARAVGDEPAYWPDGAFTKLIERLRPGFKENSKLANMKFVRQLLLGGTPEGYTEYAHNFSGADFLPQGVKLKVGDREMDLVYRSKERDRLTIHYPTYLNNKLIEQDPGFIRALLADYGHDSALVKAHLFGQFCALHENAVYQFKDDNEVEIMKDHTKSHEIYMGIDFNVGKMAWVAGQKINGNMFYTDEVKDGVINTFEACDDFVRKFNPNLWKNHTVVVDGDASGYAGDTRFGINDYDIIYQQLSKHYNKVLINAPRKNPAVRTRVMTTNRALRPNEATGKQIQVFNSKDIRYTNEAIRRTVYNPKGTDIYKPSDDRVTHRSDGWSYSVINQIPFTPETLRRGQSW